MRIERIQKLAFRTVSQIGIQYRDGPLAETLDGLPRTAPRAGDRFPWLRLTLVPNGPVEDLFKKLDDTRFNLIMIGQPLPEGVARLDPVLAMYAIPNDDANDRELKRAHIPQPSFYLLRPDGHVGLAGVRYDASAAIGYVSERLHIAKRT